MLYIQATRVCIFNIAGVLSIIPQPLKLRDSGMLYNSTSKSNKNFKDSALFLKGVLKKLKFQGIRPVCVKKLTN